MLRRGTPIDPYPSTGGTTILRLSPTHMPLELCRNLEMRQPLVNHILG